MRTEAAEVYEASGNLIAPSRWCSAVPQDAPIEHVAALARYMIGQEMYGAVRDLLLPRLKVHDTNLELRILMLEALQGRAAEAQA